VESFDYFVIVNEDIVDPIIPGRGLRQRDPLLLCLFIIYVKVLSALIRQVEARGDIHGTIQYVEMLPLFFTCCFKMIVSYFSGLWNMRLKL
jgi:hypothetical protein